MPYGAEWENDVPYEALTAKPASHVNEPIIKNGVSIVDKTDTKTDTNAPP